MGKENDWSTYHRLRNSVTRIIRYNKATYTSSVLQQNINRPKQFWEQTKNVIQQNPQKIEAAKYLV